MKNKTIILSTLCLGSLLAFASPLTFAADLKSQPGEMVKVLKDLQAKNYIIVKKIKFDDNKGDFKADVLNAEGKTIEITINPKTGQMVKPKDDITGWTAVQIAKKVADAGYKNIYEIDTEMFGHEYHVKVLDTKQEKVTIKVDVETGKITKISD
jgi:uncharacterized membrane protein YkoI